MTKRKIAIPGEKLCSVTKAIPGENVIVNRQKIYSVAFGEVILDKENHIHVFPLREVNFPRKNDLALGIVYNTTEILVWIRLVCALRNNKIIPYNGIFTGVIHRSQTGMVGDPRQIFGLGDIVLTRVLSSEFIPLMLSTREPETGIVAGYCNKDGVPLEKRDEQLFCPLCKKTVRKKMSIHYNFKQFRALFFQYYEVKRTYVV